MRKLCLSIICLSVMLSLGAISFNALESKALYPESSADPYSFTSSFGLISPLCLEDCPTSIALVVIDPATSLASYEKAPLNQNLSSKADYLNLKAGMSLGLMRFKENKLEIEVSLAGYINTVFCTFGGFDCLGFDGSYFFGLNLKYSFITMRFGLHHFSGHYGDEILEDLYSDNQIDFQGSRTITIDGKAYVYSSLVQYVRDNSWLLSINASLPFGFSLYAQAELPKKESWMRPFSHVCESYTNPSNHLDLLQRIGSNEGVSEAQIRQEEELKKNSSYRAWRLNLGLNYSYSFEDFTLFTAFDLQAHQDGQTGHQIGSYDPSNAWETELSFALGLVMEADSKTLSVEASYCDGRFKLLNFFYERSRYLKIGLTIL